MDKKKKQRKNLALTRSKSLDAKKINPNIIETYERKTLRCCTPRNRKELASYKQLYDIK